MVCSGKGLDMKFSKSTGSLICAFREFPIELWQQMLPRIPGDDPARDFRGVVSVRDEGLGSSEKLDDMASWVDLYGRARLAGMSVEDVERVLVSNHGVGPSTLVSAARVQPKKSDDDVVSTRFSLPASLGGKSSREEKAPSDKAPSKKSKSPSTSGGSRSRAASDTGPSLSLVSNGSANGSANGSSHGSTNGSTNGSTKRKPSPAGSIPSVVEGVSLKRMGDSRLGVVSKLVSEADAPVKALVDWADGGESQLITVKTLRDSRRYSLS